MPPLDQDSRVFEVPRGVLNEPELLTLLSPAMITNVSAQFADELFCSDASPSGLGSCVAKFPRGSQRDLAPPQPQGSLDHA